MGSHRYSSYTLPRLYEWKITMFTRNSSRALAALIHRAATGSVWVEGGPADDLPAPALTDACRALRSGHLPPGETRSALDTLAQSS